jgi:glycerol-3-phosphate cytidylyltransferase
MIPNGKTLLTMGTFDPPLFGHAGFFKQCELYCERLIIGVNSDRFIEQYRGRPPSKDQDFRLGIIKRWHDAEVVLNDGPGRDLIMRHHPDVIAIGSDWAPKDFYSQINFSLEEFDAANIALIYIPYRLGSEHDISATSIKEFYKQ